jgi:hypothetical protein
MCGLAGGVRDDRAAGGPGAFRFLRARAIADTRPAFYPDLEADTDLLLTLPGGRLWAVEIRRSAAPRLERGFHVACEDIEPVRRFLVHSGPEAFPLAHGVEAMPLRAAAEALIATG